MGILLDELGADELRRAHQLLAFVAVQNHEFKYIVPAPVHSERRVPHALFGVDSIGGQSARLAAADLHPHASFLQAQLVDALHFHSQSHNKFITMKNQVVNRAFENLFQLNTEPIYVTQ